MSIEAMKQALEALDEAANVLTSRMFADAAAALREAIEQAEKQEPVALPCCSYTDASAIKWNPLNGVVQCHNCGQTYIPPAAQEPVAWQQELGNILCLIHRDGGDYISEHGWRKAIDDATLKVANLNSYMSVPQYEHTREWVGLTNEEIEAVMQGSVEGERMLPYQFARAIEAKLRTKNEAP